MSAERGWIGEPQPARQWHDSHYSREADRIAQSWLEDTRTGRRRDMKPNNSLSQFSASPDLQNEFVGAVIGAMESHTDLSTQILNNSEISQKLMGELVPIVYKALQATA
jgi:hypothetical protein